MPSLQRILREPHEVVIISVILQHHSGLVIIYISFAYCRTMARFMSVFVGVWMCVCVRARACVCMCVCARLCVLIGVNRLDPKDWFHYLVWNSIIGIIRVDSLKLCLFDGDSCVWLSCFLSPASFFRLFQCSMSIGGLMDRFKERRGIFEILSHYERARRMLWIEAGGISSITALEESRENL